ncbi:MAG: polysaccharide deacetylase, partial [Firmicutes bacterium]|nr:polysaccharide deacetylase [Bacillota bacterium]
NIPVKSIIKAVKRNCDKDGYNVILMHDSDAKATTAKALPAIIKWALDEGYEFRAMTPGCPTSHHRVNN